MRGASALQTVLEEHADVPLKVFVVWESVLASDLTTPGSKKLALVSDPRASQYWDPKLALSSEMVQAALAHPERFPMPADLPPVTQETIAWDVVFLFPPGVTWAEGPPKSGWMGAPVLDATTELDATLDQIR